MNEVEVEVLRPTRRKIGHFGVVFFSQSLGTVPKRMGEYDWEWRFYVPLGTK